LRPLAPPARADGRTSRPAVAAVPEPLTELARLLQALAPVLPGPIGVEANGPAVAVAAAAGVGVLELPSDADAPALIAAGAGECSLLCLARGADRREGLRAALTAQGFANFLHVHEDGSDPPRRCNVVEGAGGQLVLVADSVAGEVLLVVAGELRDGLAAVQADVLAHRFEAGRVIDALNAVRNTGRASLAAARVGGAATGDDLTRTVDRQTHAIDALHARVASLGMQPTPPLVAAPAEWLRRSRLRATLWRAPRIGVFHQHPPVRAQVPQAYLRARPPVPAPRISVVTPSLDQGRFIERTLQSVRGQGYPDLEHVVQDGGSRDETVAVLRRHEGSGMRWVSEPDGGQADAINRGFERSSGELMAYLNSDDLLLPGALAHVASYLAAHPEVDVVYGHRMIIDEQDRQVGIWAMPPHDDSMLDFSDAIPQETLVWRRSAWERSGGMDPTFRFALDWDFLVRLRDSGARIVRLDRYLGAFRAHPGQKTSAQVTLGESESDRLRERIHGRPMGWEEAYAAMGPYLRRHVALHTAHRVAARLPIPRVDAWPALGVSAGDWSGG